MVDHNRASAFTPLAKEGQKPTCQSALVPVKCSSVGTLNAPAGKPAKSSFPRGTLIKDTLRLLLSPGQSGTRCEEHYKQNVIGCHAAGITFTRKRTDPFPLANLLPRALSAAISGISKNSPCTGLATLGLDSESVKMPIQVVRDVADFVVSPS